MREVAFEIDEECMHFFFYRDKNSEVLEVDSEPKFRVGKVYGFRHIQNMVRKMKSGKGEKFNYIEVMACPGGRHFKFGIEERTSSKRESLFNRKKLRIFTRKRDVYFLTHYFLC